MCSGAARCTVVLNVYKKLLAHTRQGSGFFDVRDRPRLSFVNIYNEPKKYIQEIVNKSVFFC